MRKNYDSLDLTKFLLSFMVAAIHVNPFGSALGDLRFPIVRIAVPMFFLISAYLLFDKLHQIQDGKNRWRAIFNFGKRNLQLYAAWFVVQFPVIAFLRNYFSEGILVAVPKILVQFLFGSTFIASWYLMALVIGAVVVYALGNRFGNVTAIAIGAVAYAVCCLSSNYGNLLGEDSWIVALRLWYPAKIYNSFPVSLIWLGIGKLLAENKQRIEHVSPVWMGCGMVVATVGLFLEHFWIQRMDCAYTNDCYFMLVPMCVLLFVAIINVKITIPSAKTFRQLSTVIYCFHGSLVAILGAFVRKVGVDTELLLGSILLYVLVLLGCIVAAFLIRKMQRIRWLSILRYFM